MLIAMLTSVVQVAAVPAIKKKDPGVGPNLKKKNKTSKNFELEQNFHWNSVTKINSPQLNCQGNRSLKLDDSDDKNDDDDDDDDDM